MKNTYHSLFRKRILISTIFIVSFAFMILVFTTGCSNSDNNDESGSSQVIETITDENGGIFETGQAKIDFPAGSVLEDVTVTGMLISLDQLPEHLEPVSSVHQISISDEKLYTAHSATISFNIAEHMEDDGVSIYHSEDGVTWNKLESTISGNTVSTTIPGFSYFMAAKSQSDVDDSAVYSLTVINDCEISSTVCLYQHDSEWGDNVSSIVWLSKHIFNNSTVIFQWKKEYGFCWAETGVMQPGVVFQSAQLITGDLTSYNKITFTNQQGAGEFVNLTASGNPGTMAIEKDGTIPMNTYATGIAMDSSAICAAQAMPNTMSQFSFNNTKYYITIGNYQQGEILDINEMDNKAEVVFPAGVYSMTATYNEDGTWTITSGN